MFQNVQIRDTIAQINVLFVYDQYNLMPLFEMSKVVDE